MTRTEEEIRKMSNTEFMKYQWSQERPPVEINEDKIEFWSDENFAVLVSDGANYTYKILRQLEQKLGMPVIVQKEPYTDRIPAQGHGTALLTDVMAERKVSEKLYSNLSDPKLFAITQSRREERFSGVTKDMLQSSIGKVRKITNWETGEYEVVETTLARYLTDPSFHTTQSIKGVLEAESYLEPERLDSLERVITRIEIRASNYGLPVEDQELISQGDYSQEFVESQHVELYIAAK